MNYDSKANGIVKDPLVVLDPQTGDFNKDQEAVVTDFVPFTQNKFNALGIV